MLEILGFIALIAIIFGVSFSSAIGIIVKAIVWFFGIMAAIALIGHLMDFAKKEPKKKVETPKLPTIKPYTKLEKKPGIKYKYDLLDPTVRKALDIIFGNQSYTPWKMESYLGKEGAKKVEGLDKWLMSLGVLDTKNVSGKQQKWQARYNLKITDIDEFADLVGLKK